jgi:hypothetical protein
MSYRVREARLRLVGRERGRAKERETVRAMGWGMEGAKEMGRGREKVWGRGRGWERERDLERGWGRVPQGAAAKGMVGVSLGCCTAQWALPQTGAVCLLGTCRWSGCNMLGAGWPWCWSSRCTGSEPHTLQVGTVTTHTTLQKANLGAH